MDSSISSISNTSIKGYDDNDSDNFYNDNMSYKTEKSSDNERELLSVKSYKSSNYYGKIKTNNIGSTINCDNNFYYNIENNIYENDEDGTNAYEIMQMLKDYEINKVASPFLVAPCKKKYTLVLDLDETLIHLRQKKDIINIKNDINIKINNTSDYFYDNYDKNNNKYLLQFRVGLFSFLTILKPFYEIISFTSATREYADVIINEIEKNRKFFDHKFYREHTIIYKDTFVKDISRIGRDIKKIIIVDNNERNFILNKENGIKIAPYYGDEDNNNVINNSINSENNGRLSYRGKKGNDNILLELKKILVMIYKDNYDDLREALKDYEDLIKTKVSMNF
jgi:Dullard-like phosphatase family protein